MSTFGKVGKAAKAAGKFYYKQSPAGGAVRATKQVKTDINPSTVKGAAKKAKSMTKKSTRQEIKKNNANFRAQSATLRKQAKAKKK